MVHRSCGGRSCTRMLSALVALSLAVLATLGAALSQRPHEICCDSTTCCELESAAAPIPAFCFDPDNPPSPAIMDWINSLHDTTSDFQLATSYWGTGSGTPVTLTWSLVPDGTSVPGLSGQANAPSVLFSRMNQLFNNNQALWIGLIEQSFDRWSELTGVNFVRVTYQGNPWDDGAAFPNSGSSSTRGHFRIGMRAFSSSGVLAFNYYPTVSDMVINSTTNWTSGGSSTNYRFFRNVVMHEIGHGLGIAHCCPAQQNKLMEPAISTGFDGPQHDDVRGAQVRYGDYYSNNSSIGAASDLGSLAVGQTLLPSTVPGQQFNYGSRTSIDRLADQDWFRFNISGPLNLNVSAIPVGHSYLSGPQLQGGACSSGSTVNSLTAAALGIMVLGPNTSTVIATADSNPAGSTESITDLMLTQPGNYYVRVYATTASGPQFYRLQINATSGSGTCPSFTQHPSNATVCAGGQIQFSVQATGSPQPTFQWRRNGVDVQGATSNSYTIPSVTTLHAGSYDCVVTNSCGSETSNAALLTVNSPPVFTTHPDSQTVEEGEPVVFLAEATATPTASFRWYKDTVLIPGGTNGILAIQSASLSDAGIYRAEALNGCGAVPSNPATLTVTAACYANCDGSTAQPILNVDDFTCFINEFAAAQSLPHAEQVTHYANCDGSTTSPALNVDDFTCFINAFAQGCP